MIDGEPLTGGVTEAGRRGVATCYQELSLIRDVTVAENLSLGKWPTGRFGIDRRRMVRSARATLERLGADIDPDTVVSSLTLAQQQIVEIARAVQEEPKLLILDEPTSALATAEVDIVLATVQRLSAEGVAVIYVSHRMDEIRQIADSATVMRNGRIIETVSIAGADTNRIIHLMLGEALDSAPTVRRARTDGEVLLQVEDLAIAPKLDGVTFDARAGEVLGIAGLLGAGRTELLRAIAGHDRIRSGTVRVRGTTEPRPTPRRMRQLGIGMTPEDRKGTGIIPGLGIDENIVMSDWKRVSSGGFLASGRIRAATKALGQRLSIKADDLTRPINTLSGKPAKAVIARWLHADSDVLLLDEPTRGVDVQAKAQIYDIMRQVADSGKAVVFVSSEAEELPLACDRVLVLRGGRIREEFTARTSPSPTSSRHPWRPRLDRRDRPRPLPTDRHHRLGHRRPPSEGPIMTTTVETPSGTTNNGSADGRPNAFTTVRRAIGGNTTLVNIVGLLVAIVLLYAYLTFNAVGFFTAANQSGLLRDAALIGVAATGMTLVIIAGEIDVSTGPAVALSSVIVASGISSGASRPSSRSSSPSRSAPHGVLSPVSCAPDSRCRRSSPRWACGACSAGSRSS